jgi:hypothetical protein
VILSPTIPEVDELKDPSHEARRFRTVLQTFERNADLLFRGSPYEPHIDHGALAAAFSLWRQAFDRSKQLADVDRSDYVIFAAGLMMKELIAAHPLSVTKRRDVSGEPPGEDIARRLARWPEGYAYASFCVALASAIIRQGGTEMTASAITERTDFWDSFRDNVDENPATAIAFFDLICGRPPNWDFPDVPDLRPAFADMHAAIATNRGDRLR